MSRKEDEMLSPAESVPISSMNSYGSTTKLCHIVKRPDFDGYGFNLHSEKAKPGQYIGKIDPNSPAELAGLKEGDRILEVNGVAINSETHKQVVQRIKAISCEVRLLLIDADAVVAGGEAQTLTHVQAQTNGNNNEEYKGTVQVIPGSSANISSISLISTKRTSTTDSNNGDSSIIGIDMTDNSITTSENRNVRDTASSTTDEITMINQKTNNNNSNSKNETPPPPSSVIATTTTSSTTSTKSINSNGNASKTGGLQLPTTAAEMRAKLLSKKKYDPKNESVDIKKKFEIIQKL